MINVRTGFTNITIHQICPDYNRNVPKTFRKAAEKFVSIFTDSERRMPL